MEEAINETGNRRKRQMAYNEEYHITPVTSTRKLNVEDDRETFAHSKDFCKNLKELCERITEKEHKLLTASDEKHIEQIRGELFILYRQYIFV